MAWRPCASPPSPVRSGRRLDQLAGTVETVLAAGKFPLVLGGEHSLTAGAIRPFAARHKDLVVLQFDAHADLRDGYQGEHFSHASAMRRVLDHPGIALVSVGIRAVSTPEVEFYEANREAHHDPLGQGPGALGHRGDRQAARWPACLCDVRHRRPGCGDHAGDGHADAGRARLLAGAGDPAPGLCGGNVVGADLVEFAPIKGFHAYDYTAAALAYKMLSYALAGKRS